MEKTAAKGNRETYRHPMLHLIKTICLAWSLKNDVKLKTIVGQALSLCLPQELAKDFQTNVLEKAQVVSISMLSKSRLLVDVGFMLLNGVRHRRESNDSRTVRYLMADSSPIKGIDFFALESWTASGGELPLDAMDYLIATRKASVEDDMERARMQELRQFHGQALQRALKKHIFPPALLGSKRASLIHKAHCMLHQLRLECGSWKDVWKYLANVVSFTTDQGTEAGLADFMAVDTLQMFPYWQPRCTMVESDSTLAAFDVPGPMVESEGEEAQQAGNTLDYLLRSCMWVPGTMHVLHGACSSITDSLEHFDTYLESQLRPIIDFFKLRYTRESFVALCLNEGPGKWQAHKFDNFSVSLAEWRWGSLLAAVEQLLQLEAPMRQYWDPAKMDRLKPLHPRDRRQEEAAERAPDGVAADGGEAGVQENPGVPAEEEEGEEEGVAPRNNSEYEAVDPCKVSAAVLDPFFWAYCYKLSSC